MGAGGLSIVNCTVVANSSQGGAAASGGTAGTGQGGGIANNPLNTTTDPSLTVENTLDAENTASAESEGPDFFGAAATTLDNLIGDGTAATGFSGNGNQVGMTGATINPLLAPLVNNGGDTDTLRAPVRQRGDRRRQSERGQFLRPLDRSARIAVRLDRQRQG